MAGKKKYDIGRERGRVNGVFDIERGIAVVG